MRRVAALARNGRACYEGIHVMRGILPSLLFLLPFIAQAQPRDFNPDGSIPGFVALRSSTTTIGGGSTIGGSYQYYRIGSGGTITLPACDKPLDTASLAYNPQGDIVVGDSSGTAGTSPIILTCPSGSIAGKPTYTLNMPYEHVWLHWTGTGVQVLAASNQPFIPELTLSQINGTTAATTISSATGQAIGDTTLAVTSASGFPSAAPYIVTVDAEQEQVTAGAGTTTWTVTRGVNGTSAAAHARYATVNLNAQSTTINQIGGIGSGDGTVTVTSASNFPASGNYVINVQQEHMLVTGGQGTTTWTITRAIDGTSAASHANGFPVFLLSPSTAINQSGGIGSGDATITVASRSGFPASGTFLIQAENEHMLVTANGTNTWPIVRGLNGTAPAIHADATPILFLASACATLPANAFLTAAAMRESNGTIIAGGIDIGTSIGALDIASAVAVSGLSYGVLTGSQFSKQYFSNSAATPLCVTPHGTWNSAVLNMRFVFAP